jgi:SAM-dependent methyltransferase
VTSATTPTAYSEAFFAQQRDVSRRSASVVVPMVLDLVRPRSVADVGCGLGTWLSVVVENGISDVVGVDGDYVNRERLLIPPDRFLAQDLRKIVRLERSFDLAFCMEVAEHIPPGSADNIVDTLTGLAPVIVFSAAIPFQGGIDHVNEQWPEYWAEKFKARGFIGIDCLRARLWNDPRVECYYAQNVALYAKPEAFTARLQKLAGSGLPFGAVHPKQYLSLVDPAQQTLRVAFSRFWQVARRRIAARAGIGKSS